MKEQLRFRQFVIWGIVGVLLAGALLTYGWRVGDLAVLRGDSVFLIQLLDNIAETGQAVSDSQDAIHDMLFIEGTLTQPADAICAREFVSKGHAPDLMPYHPYFVLYLLAPLAHILPASALLPLLTSCGIFLLMLVAFAKLETEKTPVVLSLLFVAFLTVAPQLSHALQGQYYAERFFLPVMAVMIWFLHRKETPPWLLVGLVGLCALVTERTGIVTGLYVMGFAVLHWELSFRQRVFLFVLGASCLGYACGLIALYVDNPYYSNSGFLPRNWRELAARFANPVFMKSLVVFFYFNLPFLLLGLGDWRSLLLALGLMVPNVIGSVGGAEKIAFATHYHSLYVAALIWAAASGLSNIARKFHTSVQRSAMGAVLCAALFAMLFTGVTPARTLEFGKVQYNAPILGVALKGFLSAHNGAAASFREDVETMQSIIPEGATVTTTEWGMPLVEHKRSLYYYPLGVDVAEYALLAHSRRGNRHYYSGAFSYLGAEETAKINDCLNEKLRMTGFDVDNPVWVKSGRAVLKRKK